MELPQKFLVAYATRSGSTQEVAEQIGVALRERGIDVEIQPARQIRSLEGYNAVVLGAPVYIGHWHKDAKSFLAHHRPGLIERPVAIFALGPMHVDEKEFRDVRAGLLKELEQFPWLTPAAVEIFGGKFNPHTLSFPYNMLPALKNSPPSDIRDWAAIGAWANSLVEMFQPARS